MDPLSIGLLGSTILGGASSALKSSSISNASRAQAEANQQALALQQDNLDWTKDRYADAYAEYEKWNSIYGPLQEDLNTYYTNLTGSDISNAEVARIQEATQKSKEITAQRLAQSGRDDNGVSEYLYSAMDYQSAKDKALSRATGEERAMAAKQGYGNSVNTNLANMRAGMNGIANGAQATTNSMGNLLTTQGNNAVSAANAQNSVLDGFINDTQENIGYYSRYGGGNE